MKANHVVWMGFGLRVAVALWNSAIGPTPGADGDALGLHEMAVTVAQTGAIGRYHHGYNYSYMLAVVYRLTSPSLLIGCLLSCFTWLASAYVLALVMRQLQIRETQRAVAMAVYALLPTAVLWTSVTMREPFEMLAVNTAVYAALCVYADLGRRFWLLLATAIAMGTLMHSAILALGVGLLPLIALSSTHRVRRRWVPGLALVTAVATAAGVAAASTIFSSFFSYPLDSGLAFAVEQYQLGGLRIGVRTDYRETVALDSTLDLLLFIPASVAQYLFEPMPWKVTALSDLGLIGENLLRAMLIASAASSLIRRRSPARGPVLIVFGAYVVLESAFALGTFNWGTAARHHVPTLGLLAVAAVSSAPVRSHAPNSLAPATPLTPLPPAG